MKLVSMVSGPISTNTYIIIDEKSNDCAVIDPAIRNREIYNFLDKHPELKIKYIIATHGHFDHVTQIEELKEKYGGEVVIHRADLPWLVCDYNARYARHTAAAKPLSADMLLDGGETLFVGDIKLIFIHTPGHTPGGMCIQCENCLFSGDTLFLNDVGRTDLEGGDETALHHSVKEVIGSINEDLKVYPGHGDPTTLSHEKTHNPYFK
ncbi:MAG: MBL fold metallo-hydrolase [Bacillota bacterium]|nr:MBL fold metallo-hydrolase [Bacillota bacterium]